MYLEHFQLSAEPFSLTPDPAFLFKSEVHAEALAALKLGLLERRGLIAMIGEVGTGKTTLLYSLLSSLGPRIRSAYIANSKLSFDGLLRSALKDFGCPADATTRLGLLDTLNTFLLDCDRQGHTAALIVDEAQNLSDDAFEELRLLSNYETYKRKLLQIVLVGQPELDEKLRKPNLRQVTERIAVRAHVNPLSKADSYAYIEHRLASVGASSDIFTKSALKFIVKRSQGIPRRINILCHNSMLYAYGRNTQLIDKPLVTAASHEREGRGLVVLGRRRQRAHGPGPFSRAFESVGTSGIAWALTGLVIGIFGAFFSMSSMKAVESARIPTPVATTVMAKAPQAPTGDEVVASTNIPADVEIVASADVPSTTDTTTEEIVAVSNEAPSHGQAVAIEEETDPGSADQIAGIVRPTTGSEPKQTTEPQPAETPTVATDDAVIEDDVVVANDATATNNAVTENDVVVAADTVVVTDDTVAAKQHSDEKRLASLAQVPTDGRADSGVAKVLAVSKGTTLTELILTVYGDYSTSLVDRTRKSDPEIDNPDFILAGDRFQFPSTSKIPSTSKTTVDTGDSNRE